MLRLDSERVYKLKLKQRHQVPLENITHYKTAKNEGYLSIYTNHFINSPVSTPHTAGSTPIRATPHLGEVKQAQYFQKQGGAGGQLT